MNTGKTQLCGLRIEAVIFITIYIVPKKQFLKNVGIKGIKYALANDAFC